MLTAAILGGVAFSGGAGRPLGIAIGVATIGILNAGLIFVGLQSWWQSIAVGGMLLLALVADQVAIGLRGRRAKSPQRLTSQSVEERAGRRIEGVPRHDFGNALSKRPRRRGP